LNAAINQRTKLASKKLHCADFVHNLPIITALTQNHGYGQKSQHKIAVFTVIVIFLQPYTVSQLMPENRPSSYNQGEVSNKQFSLTRYFP